MELIEFKEKIAASQRGLIAQFRAKGYQENFGQKEIREISDLYYDHFFNEPNYREAMVAMDQFENWCSEYTGGS